MGRVFALAIPKAEKFLLLAMADHAHDDGTEVRPGIKRLSEKTSDSERNVRRLLRSLESMGLLAPVAYTTGGRGRATEYRVPLDRLEEVLANPANLAPFPGNPDTTGPKPGHHGTETRTRSAPQPSRTVIEPSLGRARPRDDLWDRLVFYFGKPANDDERGLRNRALKLLRQAGATPDEVDRRVAAWPGLYDGATLTPKALASHWSELGRPPARGAALTRANAEREIGDRQARIDACQLCGPDGLRHFDAAGKVVGRDNPEAVQAVRCRHGVGLPTSAPVPGGETALRGREGPS